LIEDPVMIDARLMSLIILSKAVSKDEVVLTADRRVNVALNVLMSANGQAYVRTRNRLLNKLKMQTG